VPEGKKVCMERVSKKATDSFFSNSLYFSTGVLAREIEKLAIECWKPTGLSPSHAHLLMQLSLMKSATSPSRLARSLFLSPSTITRLLQKLEKKELVHRIVYDRARMVMIAPDGANLIPLIEKCEDDFRDRCKHLLGKNTSLLSRTLNESADKLREAKNDCPAADTKSNP
jgi:DNA-binding MarR family transcriptional regulator